LLVVDDGSADESWTIIQALSKANPHIEGISFSRPYGKESAIFAGLERATGEHVLVMDSDLQHPPAVIPDMMKHYSANAYDVLDGVKRSRGKESPLYRLVTDAFYAMFSRLSGLDLRNASDFKIISRQVVDELVKFREYSLFFRGLTCWVGFNHGTFEYDVDERESISSRWSVSQLFRLAVSAITSFSSSLLHIVTILGGIYLLFGFVLGIQTLYRKLAGYSVDGFTTVIILLLLVGAAITIPLGIIGQYLARIYDEVKHRPRYIIKDQT